MPSTLPGRREPTPRRREPPNGSGGGSRKALTKGSASSSSSSTYDADCPSGTCAWPREPPLSAGAGRRLLLSKAAPLTPLTLSDMSSSATAAQTSDVGPKVASRAMRGVAAADGAKGTPGVPVVTTRRDAAAKGVAVVEQFKSSSPRQQVMRILNDERMKPAAREAALAKAAVEIERDSQRLLSLDYDALVEEKRTWLAAPAIHPTEGQRWGTDWPPRVAATLRGRPVRKRYLLSDALFTKGGPVYATNIGRVVGCELGAGGTAFFELLYEDGFKEELGWHELRQTLVPHPQYDAELTALEQSGLAGVARSSNRRKRVRDKEAEAEAYLPRLGCHYSLPEGKVACRLHEELRLSGLVENDPGPDVSD